MTETIDEALPRRIAFVRGILLPSYERIGPVGASGAAAIRTMLDEVSRAMIEGDTVTMLRVYRALGELE